MLTQEVNMLLLTLITMLPWFWTLFDVVFWTLFLIGIIAMAVACSMMQSIRITLYYLKTVILKLQVFLLFFGPLLCVHGVLCILTWPAARTVRPQHIYIWIQLSEYVCTIHKYNNLDFLKGKWFESSYNYSIKNAAVIRLYFIKHKGVYYILLLAASTKLMIYLISHYFCKFQ